MSELFTNLQNKLRQYKDIGIDLTHPRGVMINDKLHFAVNKTINNIDTNTSHYHPHFEIPFESANRAFVKLSGLDYLEMVLKHPESIYGYEHKRQIGDKEEHDNHIEDFHNYTLLNNTKTANNDMNKNMVYDLEAHRNQRKPYPRLEDFGNIHHDIRKLGEEPHHSRVFRYQSRPMSGGALAGGSMTLKHNMDNNELVKHTKGYDKPYHLPHHIRLDYVTAHDKILPTGDSYLYNIKTEELKPFVFDEPMDGGVSYDG